MRPWWQIGWYRLRDILLFAGGFFGALHEAFFTTTDRPDLLVLFAGMMGLPAFFRVDESNGRRSKKSPSSEDDA